MDSILRQHPPAPYNRFALRMLDVEYAMHMAEECKAQNYSKVPTSQNTGQAPAPPMNIPAHARARALAQQPQAKQARDWTGTKLPTVREEIRIQ